MNEAYLILGLAITIIGLIIVVISETETIIRYRAKLKQLRKDNDEDAV